MVLFFAGGHALIIGAGGDLPCTISDADGIADILKDPGRCAYPPDQVELLKGEDADRAGMLCGLDKLANRTDEKSTVVIYFSGHGYQVKSSIGDFYYLMPFGYNIERLKDTAISGTEFADRLKAIKAQRLLLLLDCCHAGGLSDLKAPGLQFAKATLPPEAQSLFAQGRGRVVIPSSQADELSFAGKPYSAFTLALIDAFCGAGASTKDGYVRVIDLALHTREMVPKKTNNRQHPIADLSQADNFVLAYYAGGEKEPKGLPFAEEPEMKPQPGAWSSVRVFDQRGQTLHGPQTNITGNVQGSVHPGKSDGPMATGEGGEAVDLRNSSGTIYKPIGRVEQHIGDEITQIIQREKLPVPRIPPPPEDFTGRVEELEKMQKAFDRGTSIIGIWGTGGIGKTALALKLADKLKCDFADGQIFLNMEGTSGNPLKPAYAMAQVIRAFRGYNKDHLPDDQNELKGLYHAVLNGKKVLLLLDNASDDKQVEPLLPPMGCAVLITSRYRFILPGMPEPFALGVMKPEEAIELLQTICKRLTLEQASEMAKLCGCLPLALRAAASLLQVKIDMSISTYLDDLRSERTRLQALGKVGVERDLEASLDLSYRRLPEEMARVFRLLSVFPADFDAAAEEVICQDEGHSHLSELVLWSLVYFRRRSPDFGRYSLHELVRIFASSKLTDQLEKDELYWRHAEYYFSVLNEANSLCLKCGNDILKGKGLFDLEQKNILAVQDWALREFKSMQEDSKYLLLKLLCSFPHAGSCIFALWLDPQKHIKFLKDAYDAACELMNERRACPNLNKRICSHLYDRGKAYNRLSLTNEAIESHRKQLATAHRYKYKKEEGDALYQIGRNYADEGKLKSAIKCYKKAHSVYEHVNDHRGIVKSLAGKGIILRYIGDVSDAIKCHQEAFQIAESNNYDKEKAYSLNNLGNDYVDQNKIEDALKCYRQALAIDRSMRYRIGVVADLGNIGYAFAVKGDDKKAANHLKAAIKISEKIGDRKGQAKAEAIMGLVCEKEGDYDDAIKHHKNALDIVEKIGYRRRKGQSYVNIANAHTSNKKYDDAIKCLEKAIKLAEEIKDRKGEAKAKAMLGIAYFKKQKFDIAIKCHESALEIVQNIKYRRREGNAFNNLGNDYAAIDISKALKYYNKALKIYKDIDDSQGIYNTNYNISILNNILNNIGPLNSGHVSLQWLDDLKW